MARHDEQPQNRPQIVYLSRARLHRPRANVIQTVKTVEGLARIGVSVELHLPPWNDKRTLDDILRRLGVSTPIGIQGHSGLRSFWKPLAFAPYFWRRKDVLRKTPAVYTRSVDLSLALLKHGIPHSFEIHDMEALKHRGFLKTLVAGHLNGLIRHFFPISHAAAQGLVEYGVDPRRIHVCPCGADLAMFENIAAWKPSGLRRPHVMYVGRISRDRGLGVLEKLAQQGSCRVTVVGAMDDRPQTERIRLVSYVPHHVIPRYLEQADILVMPYQRNLPHAGSISPMKLFEAMAAGRPIVVSDLEPIREIIRHGENGLCVNPDDNEAWVAAVRFLQEHPHLAERMAAQAKQEAERYSWENRARVLQHALLSEYQEARYG